MTDSMDHISGNFNFDLPKNRSNVIKVIGIGGGGGNAINYMFQQGIVGVDFVICNTDSQALEKSAVPIKIQLGASLTEGLGAGANPDVGRQAAQESFEDIKTLLSTQTKMIFITAGMGGGTGTGAAPIIARMAKEMDILTVGIVTMPFQFEGKIRLEQAQKGMEELKSSVDSLIVINNNKLREVYGNLGFRAGFAKADEVLATAARGIAEVITHHYTQNIDLKDAKTVLSNSGSAIMGSALAEGANRAQECIVKALDSPLLNDNKITGCKNVLLLIVSGEEEITIDEIGEINDFIQTEAGNHTNIIMGVGDDPSLGNKISVTIIATGFNSEQQHEIVNTEAKKVIHTLEDEQTLTHDLTTKNIPKEELVFESPMKEVKLEEEPIIKYVLEEEIAPTNLTVEASEEKSAMFHEALNEIVVNDVEIVLPTEEVRDLEEEGNPLIPSNEFIRQIEVVAEEISFEASEGFDHLKEESVKEYIESDQLAEDSVANEEAFVFNEISTAINAIEVVDPEYINEEEKQQIQFDFELPMPLEASASIPEDSVEKPVETFFKLEEDMEEQMKVEEAVEEKSVDGLVLKNVDKEKVISDSSAEKDLHSPFNQSIQESIKQQNEKRKEQLKQFNYTFKNNLNRIEEMEREPAYKRLGFDLEEPAGEVNPPSTMSLDKDSNDDEQLRSNNSFLHDNVD